MRRDLDAKKVRHLVKQLRRLHVEDANCVLAHLDPVRRGRVLALLSSSGDPRWRERLPQAPKVRETPAPVAPQAPRWLETRTQIGAPSAQFLKITPAAIAALHAAQAGRSADAIQRV